MRAVLRRIVSALVGIAVALPCLAAAAPTAGLHATPTTGAPPLAVQFDTGSSSLDSGAKLLLHVLFYGNGDGTTLATATEMPAYGYALPGLYEAQTLLVEDSGAFALSAPVAVTVSRRRDGRVPPTVTMNVSSTTDPMTFAFLPVAAAAAADDPIAAERWDFGDGTGSGEAQPFHTYAVPGLYQAQLLATTQSGMMAFVRVIVAVSPDGKLAPSLLAAAGPGDVAVGAPITVTGYVLGVGGAKVTAAVVAWPGLVDAAPAVTPTMAGYTVTSQHSFTTPGYYDVPVAVQLAGSMQTLVATAHIMVAEPAGGDPSPLVLLPPSSAAAEGAPYQPNGPGAGTRALLIGGAGPFAVGPAAPSPPSLSVDASGNLSWTPTHAEVGPERLAVRIVDADGNEMVRDWVVAVTPRGGGCSAAPGRPADASALALVMLLALAWGARRALRA